MGHKQPVRDVGEPLMLTYEEARIKLGVSLSQLYKLMKNGEIHALKLDTQVRRIPMSELDAYVKRLVKEQIGKQSEEAA
jgi:excisionase family DNA binding protein